MAAALRDTGSRPSTMGVNLDLQQIVSKEQVIFTTMRLCQGALATLGMHAASAAPAGPG
jgi:hypothetical protein